MDVRINEAREDVTSCRINLGSGRGGDRRRQLRDQTTGNRDVGRLNSLRGHDVPAAAHKIESVRHDSFLAELVESAPASAAHTTTHSRWHDHGLVRATRWRKSI